VKYKKQTVSISYDSRREGFTDNLILESEELPSPEFVDALKSLKLACCEMLEIDGNNQRRIQPYGVSFSYDSDGGISAVISFMFDIPDTGNAVVINTPPSKKCDVSIESVDALWNMVKECKAYIDGKRAQTNLFDAEQPHDADETVPADVKPAELLDIGDDE
jgi:hypothetical protein